MRFRPLVVVLALALVTPACGGSTNGGGDGKGDEPTAATGRFAQVHSGVCAAAQFSAAGDQQRAEDAFNDVHFGVHALVQALEQEDRAAAARLLEDMQRTETSGTTADLEALVDAVADAIERTGGTAPDTCP